MITGTTQRILTFIMVTGVPGLSFDPLVTCEGRGGKSQGRGWLLQLRPQSKPRIYKALVDYLSQTQVYAFYPCPKDTFWSNAGAICAGVQFTFSGGLEAVDADMPKQAGIILAYKQLT